MTCRAEAYQNTIDSDIYYGLITLIELADKYDQKGCTLSFISEKHKISISRLSSIAQTLELINLVCVAEDRLYLPEAPEGLWILRSSSILKNYFINNIHQNKIN